MLAIETLNSLADVWAETIIAALWQSTLIAGVVALAALALRRSSPAVRYWLWQIVASKLLLAPIWSPELPVAWLPGWIAPELTEASATRLAVELWSDSPQPAAIAADELSLRATAHRRAEIKIAHSPTVSHALASRLTWPAWLLLAWGSALLVQLALLRLQARRLRKLLRRTRPAGDPIISLVQEVALQLGLRRTPQALLVNEVCSPFVCGLWRPRLVLPESLQTNLNRNELRLVILHELAHLRRCDLFFHWLPQLARMTFFFHPVAHWVAFRARLEAELACDGWAMSSSGASVGEYADVLVAIIDRLSAPPLPAVISAASLHSTPTQRPFS